MRLALRLTLLILSIFVLALMVLSWEQEGLIAQRYEDMRSGQVEALLTAVDEGATLAWHVDGTQELERYLARLSERQDHFAVHLVSLDAVEKEEFYTQLPSDLRARVRDGERMVTVDRHAATPVIVGFDRLAVSHEAGVPLGVTVQRTLSEEAGFVHTSLWSFLRTTGLTVLVSLVAAVILGTRLLSRPLEHIVAKARQVGRGDFTVRFLGEPQSSSEMSLLTAELDAMVQQLGALRDRAEQEVAARLAAVEGMRHADRLATVGTLAAGIAHELGTPLHVVTGRAKRIADSPESTEQARIEAESIRTQCERMRLIVEQLLTFARKPGGAPNSVSLGEVAGRITAWLEPVARKKDARLELVMGESDVRCLAHVGLVEQALTNVTLNAIQAVHEGGTVRVSTRAEKRDGTWAVLEVSDDGSGIAPEIRSKIFDPFFTTKSVGDGTGLGLAITHEILHEQGGYIVVDSRTPAESSSHGTTMGLFFQAEVP